MWGTANLATSRRAASRLAATKLRGASGGGLGTFLGLVRGTTNLSTRGASSSLVGGAANDGANEGFRASFSLVIGLTSGFSSTNLRRFPSSGGLGAFLGLVVREGNCGLVRSLRRMGKMMMLPPLVMPPRLAVFGDGKTKSSKVQTNIRTKTRSGRIRSNNDGMLIQYLGKVY